MDVHIGSFKVRHSEEAWAHMACAGNRSLDCKCQHLIRADLVLSFSFTLEGDFVSLPV